MTHAAARRKMTAGLPFEAACESTAIQGSQRGDRALQATASERHARTELGQLVGSGVTGVPRTTTASLRNSTAFKGSSTQAVMKSIVSTWETNCRAPLSRQSPDLFRLVQVAGQQERANQYGPSRFALLAPELDRGAVACARAQEFLAHLLPLRVTSDRLPYH